jgi:N-acetylglucosaminyl-diphospho-decaprenol L-rhamnosyltransferase
MHDIAAVIVSHNSERDLAPCIDSLRARAVGCRLAIVVVDSGSTDASVSAASDLGVRTISCSNIGYGAANNVGWHAADPARYLLILNPDAKVIGGSLREFVAHADRHPGLGVFAPRVVTAAGEPVPSIAPFESARTQLVDRLAGRPITCRYEPVRETRPFDWATGCALFLRAACFDRVGGFDERFFLYAEERDLLRSTHEAGWLHQTYPQVTVCHESTERPPEARLFAQLFRADLYYARKWGGISAVVATRGALATDLLRRLVLGQRDEWTSSYLAALRVVLTERVGASPGRAREIQRRRTLGSV